MTEIYKHDEAMKFTWINRIVRTATLNCCKKILDIDLVETGGYVKQSVIDEVKNPFWNRVLVT